MMQTPLVTIAIPCYNEVNFIEETINSALSQTYPNIEVIVCDNCSTDGTTNIVQKYASKNKLIHIRHTKNVGVLSNFIHALHTANGKYFMWLGGHDIINSDIVASALNVFYENKKASLVYHQHQFIDVNGNLLKTEPLPDISTGKSNKFISAINVYQKLSYCTHIHGVFKTSFRKKIPAYNGIGPDHLMLFSFAISGKIYQVNKPYYIRREFRKKECHEETIKRYQNVGIVISDKDPYFELYKAHIEFITNNSILTVFHKLILFIYFLRSANNNYRNKYLKMRLHLSS